MRGFIWTISISFIAGMIATIIRMIVRIVRGVSRTSNELNALLEPSGFILATAIGFTGAFVATFIGQAFGWYRAAGGAGLIGATVGALLMLFILERRPTAAKT